MDGQIRHLRCRYRVIGPRSTARAVAKRLDYLAHEQVRRELAAILDQACGDDLAVYLLRRVRGRMTTVLDPRLTDTTLARRWAEHLACAIIRTIADGSSDGDLMRFENQAEFVAQFINDLLRGTAWERWFYSPFMALRTLGPADALRTVLLDNREHLPTILGVLHRNGMLDRTLAVLGETNQRHIWSAGLGAIWSIEHAAIRPLFASALDLMDQLALWSHSRPQAETLFHEYLASRPSPADWRDRRGLAESLLAVLHFLDRQGYVRRAGPLLRDGLRSKVDQVLSSFDWVDIDWFRAHVEDLLFGSALEAVRPLIASARPPDTAALVEVYFPGVTLPPEQHRADLSSPAEAGLELSALAETIRPWFAQTLWLLDQLDGWSDSRPNADDLLRDYLTTRLRQSEWKIHASPTAALLDMLRFLADQDYLRQRADAELKAFLRHLDTLLPHLTWLDAGTVRTALTDLLDTPHNRAPYAVRTGVTDVLGGAEHCSGELPLGLVRSGPTQRQSELLADLALALCQGQPLNRSAPLSPANALQWYAALIDYAPGWTNDPIVTGFIQRLLEVWSRIAGSDSPQAILLRLHHGDLAGVLHMLPQSQRGAATGSLEFLARLGEPALVPLAILLGISQDTTPAPRHRSNIRLPRNYPDVAINLSRQAASGSVVETDCAGVALLLRAILDTRLPGIVERVGLPHANNHGQLSAMLVALGLRWAGAPGLCGGQLDAALALLAGLTDVSNLNPLSAGLYAIQAIDYNRLQVELLQILVGQRLLCGTELHLYDAMLSSGERILVASAEERDLWCLGRVITSTADITQTIADWQAVWKTVTGHQPALIIDESLRATLPDSARLDQCVVGDQVAASHDLGSAAQLHIASRQALLVAVQSLGASWPGLPDADLSITLFANGLLRIWSRWLQRGFAASSTPYLLENFIRRPGRLLVDATSITVEMESRPLDVVIEIAGYTADLEQVAWLGRRRVRFRSQR